MPNVEWNQEMWGERYDWQGKKPGWCEHTPGNEIDWRLVLYPRVYDFLPANTILEIAPGHGRWTHFLKGYCKELHAVDLAPRCIEWCKERFKTDTHIKYYQNDGMDLSFIPDNQIDFVFSFDSLVHVDRTVIDSYLFYLSTKLTPNGVGFFHHSNCAALLANGEMVPEDIRGARDQTVSAMVMQELCDKHGLCCIAQEVHTWNCDLLTDCMSIFCKKGSKWERDNIVTENEDFVEDRKSLRTTFKKYLFGNNFGDGS